MMGLRSKVGMGLLAMTLLVPTMASAAEETTTDSSTTVVVNGTEFPAVKNMTITMWLGSMVMDINGERTVTMDVVPEIINQMTYVPLKYFADAIGAELTWSENGVYTTLTTDELTASFKHGDTVIMVNGAEVELGAYIGEKDGRTLVPIRALGSLLGWTIGYELDGTIYLTKAFK
ncbi:hypothetical protein FHS18_006731 [Paenibacillus phyllosphaerae]|uniref:Copper amine oxidase-like N-terminal domain-containing protein n=1 Tax=Paenibacillus phyllosphaerae TaxID=274593 RepID=A0A7W5B5L5_9BACL|nr:copper amine oxidase N-terminal domain-containing protein [Paenibacillus phyllosphaerae]MBB3114609.1 hypothetical protein [Paenibacillus phyllosphaerae]